MRKLLHLRATIAKAGPAPPKPKQLSPPPPCPATARHRAVTSCTPAHVARDEALRRGGAAAEGREPPPRRPIDARSAARAVPPVLPLVGCMPVAAKELPDRDRAKRSSVGLRGD
jgi:hypothetical protein